MQIRSPEALHNLHWVVFYHVKRPACSGKADDTRQDLASVSVGVSAVVVVVCCLAWSFIHSNLHNITDALITNIEFQASKAPEC